MELTPFFKSILEEDRAPVVLCGLDHTVLYMNPSAQKRYRKYGGASLLGKSLLDCHNAASQKAIEEIIAWFRQSPKNNRVYTSHHSKDNSDIYVIALRDGAGNLIGYYEKHENRTPETQAPYAYVSDPE